MKKSEYVYREMLYQRLDKKQYQFTQLALAKKLGISLSTVNNSLAPLEAMGAITKTPMGFKLIDPKKLLIFWASKRNLQKDIAYQTRIEAPITEIEKNMPSKIAYAAYTAYKFKFNDVPADYGEIYVYATEKTLREIKTRFPQKNGPSNLIVLKADVNMEQCIEKDTCSIANIFVDMWNIGTWYAKEFLQALEKKVDRVLA